MANHEGNYIQGFEAALNASLNGIAGELLDSLEDLATEQISIQEFKELNTDLINDYAEALPTNADIDSISETWNDILNRKFGNIEIKGEEPFKEEFKSRFNVIPYSDDLTSLIIQHYFNLKMFCLGLWTVGGYLDYLNDFCSDFCDYYSELLSFNE